MENEVRKKYKTKAKDSFRTKKNLFLFQVVTDKKITFSEKDFENFSITNDLVLRYTSEYWQQPTDYEINGLRISAIIEKFEILEKENSDLLNRLENSYINNFSEIYPEIEFENLLSKTKCHYCNITIQEIDQLGGNKKLYKKTLRGWKLEIDRLNSNFEYKPDNCVISCYWCNNAKTDEFTELEFVKIGKEIRKVWEERLK
jgi:hypothetical protein